MSGTRSKVAVAVEGPLGFPQRLAARRVAFGMSQVKLAQRIHVHAFSVSEWETGHNAPNMWRVIEICKALECSADWLLGINYGEVQLPVQQGQVPDPVRVPQAPGLLRAPTRVQKVRVQADRGQDAATWRNIQDALFVSGVRDVGG